MADYSENGACGGEEIYPDLAVEGVINVSLDEDELNLFITPSNTNEVSSGEEDDGYLIDYLTDKSLLNMTSGDAVTLTETSGGGPAEGPDLNNTLTMVSPTPGSKKLDGISSVGVFDLGFSLVSQEVEEEGDILSLRKRIEANNPNLAIFDKNASESQEFAKEQMFPYPGNNVTEKPPKSKPKKGFKTKGSGVKGNGGSKGQTVNVKVDKGTKKRFHTATDDEIAKLQMDSKAERTHSQTRWGINILREWLKFTGRPVDFEATEPAELGVILKHFYAEVRTKDGREYSRSSLCCIRAAIQRHLSGPPYNSVINVMADGHFKSANSLISGTIRNMKRRGAEQSEHHSAISEQDIDLMYTSGVLSTLDPVGLLYKTFFEVSLHFGRRGREGLRELDKSDIIFKLDDEGVEYATLNFNPHEKNHPGKTHHEAQHVQKMYSTGGPDCPVASLKLYMSKLHPDCESFFQQPRGDEYKNSQIWYRKAAVGVNTSGTFMSTISDKAGLQNRYTNHCIRATTVTSLRNAGVAPSDIVAVTGHRSIASIESYSSCSDAMRRNMSRQLSKVAGVQVEEEPIKNRGSCVISKGAKPKDFGVKDTSPVREVPPVMVVKPTPKHEKKINSPTRFSPRIAAQKETKKSEQSGFAAKKLVYLEDESTDVHVSTSSGNGKQVIIIKGGNINIHYH